MSNTSSSVSSGASNPANEEPPEMFVGNGVPSYCWCGEEVVRLTARTEENQFRRFFRCQYAADAKLRKDKHVFKWVEDGFYEEFENIGKRLWRVDNELELMKKAAADRIKQEDRIEDHIMHQLDEMIGAVDHRRKKNIAEMETSWKNNLVEMETSWKNKMVEMEARWKKYMVIICGFFVLFVCVSLMQVV